MTAQVACLTDVSIDDLLSGALLSPRTYPHCGRAPDFEDEETVVEDRLREAVLKLVRGGPELGQNATQNAHLVPNVGKLRE